jgi:hypothetical protein
MGMLEKCEVMDVSKEGATTYPRSDIVMEVIVCLRSVGCIK